MLVHLHNALFLFELEPRSFRDLIPDIANDVLVRLGAMLQLIERILKLVYELPRQVISAICQTGGFQISDRTDLVPPCLHGDLWQVPPRTRRLRSFVLLRRMPILGREPVSDETGKLVSFEHA